MAHGSLDSREKGMTLINYDFGHASYNYAVKIGVVG
jgi:hypothetical protein